jgi:hypothetical protein
LASGAAGSFSDHLQSQILFFGRRRLEENRNDRLTAFPDRSSDQGYSPSNELFLIDRRTEWQQQQWKKR